jgi:hypothetical protein
MCVRPGYPEPLPKITQLVQQDVGKVRGAVKFVRHDGIALTGLHRPHRSILQHESLNFAAGRCIRQLYSLEPLKRVLSCLFGAENRPGRSQVLDAPGVCRLPVV